jgi:glyoxylase-like metal-dependent hydrolase (beta-lactamase superfamily II)
MIIALGGVPSAQSAQPVIQAALRAMGAESLNSITYSGAAGIGNFGQSRTISFGLASSTIRNYTRTIDFAQSASRVTGFIAPPAVHGLPQPGEFEEVVAANDGWDQQLEIWVTPWGFLRGAVAHAATVREQKIDGTSYQVVTWSPARKAPSGQPYRVIGYLNSENLLERVETWVEHPVLGDLPVEVRYRDYRDIAGLKVPGRIAERRQGMELFVAVIDAVQANPPDVSTRLTPSVRFLESRSTAATAADLPRASGAGSEMIAEGVYQIPGEYSALAIDMRDYVVVAGGGGDAARGQAIIAETKRLLPNKPIKYVVSTHPHFDYLSVLPPFVAEGITILADDVSRYFIERALGNPRTLVGDTLARSRKQPKVEGIVEKLVLTERARSIELHHLEKFEHSDATLIVYLPREKILFTDVDIPPPGQPATPAIQSLLQNLDRLQIDFNRVVTVRPNVRERSLSKADLMALAQLR